MVLTQAIVDEWVAKLRDYTKFADEDFAVRSTAAKRGRMRRKR